MAITRESPLTVLPGVGRVKAEHYAKMGIHTLGELLLHYPRAYENRGDVCLLSEARTDAKSAVILTVATEPRCVRLRSHKSFLKFRAYDDSGSCEIIFFNQDYLRTTFPIGSTFRFFGRVDREKNKYTMSSPAFEAWTEFASLPPFHAIYRTTEGIHQSQIMRDVSAALELLAASEEDYLPPALLEKRSLCTLSFARRNIHAPTDAQALASARRRLVYDEFFCFAVGAAITAKREKTLGAPPCTNRDVTPLTRLLPYELTGAQKRAIEDVARDMARPVPMARILVGDVGCGKTVCAAAAIFIAVSNGRQAALMVPTEILARQHYREMQPLFASLGISCALLVGATPAAQKRKIKDSLASPEASLRLQVVIGTHALLSDGVEFAAPGIVITDEQHRFGARQRALLSEKNTHAHLLVMSATPIPRSLALVLYGDLDISRIDEMPPGRQRVDTFTVDESYRDRLNAFIHRQVKEGGQVYVVCPAIEEREESEDEITLSEINPDGSTAAGRPPLKAALPYTEALKKALPDVSVAFLHGKMKSTEKDAIMKSFSENEIQVLVSTTVIEVGVNVPNASLMIVEDADRFGLSQLHQLRGRVGRGDRKAYCVLVAGGEDGRLSSTSRARLGVMRTTYDGYRIAEEDLALRGPGDFLASGKDAAIRQSGGLSFRLADAGEDVSLLSEATMDARELLERDPALESTPQLRTQIRELFTLEAGLIS